MLNKVTLISGNTNNRNKSNISFGTTLYSSNKALGLIDIPAQAVSHEVEATLLNKIRNMILGNTFNLSGSGDNHVIATYKNTDGLELKHSINVGEDSLHLTDGKESFTIHKSGMPYQSKALFSDIIESLKPQKK